jgi:hypothetical protein
MRILAIPPGPLVGRARDFLLELRIAQDELGRLVTPDTALR